ncbi:MAG: cytochrome c maturation protein CcmE [SAR202 cluster bacterium]|nr:cytochrome c maturation protein CcmE [SAR202 cluster bacterium]
MSQAEPSVPQQFAEVTAPSNNARRIKIFVSIAAIASAMVYFGFMTFQSATVYYYTVDELMALTNVESGKTVKVAGKLVPETFSRDDGSTVASFTLRNENGERLLSARHNGVVPDLFFNEHAEIILEGTYTPGGVFNSTNVIVKCPSKYVAAAG